LDPCFTHNSSSGDIHPPPKQAVSKRLANAALALRYDKPVAWKSPTYKASVQLATATNLTIWTANPTAYPTSSEPTANPTGTRSEISGAVSLEVAFDDVGADGLELVRSSSSSSSFSFSSSTLILRHFSHTSRLHARAVWHGLTSRMHARCV